MRLKLPILARNPSAGGMPRPAVIKPPCPQCGAQTFSFWTWIVGAAWVIFFPAGAAMLLWKPTFRCWNCGCKFKSSQPSEALAPVRVSASQK
ncbi:MAG TPA: hypothetical protein VG433_04445 [Pirellulales bacterium]|jgi:hypothetical protein|nr:hypothetical protein [Pirellulales bacterium]